MPLTNQGNTTSITGNKPHFFYGYIIVICSFIMLALTFGINYSFGIFFNSLVTEFGWSRAATSAAYSLMTLVAGFLGIFAGRLSDFFGPKVLGIASGIFLGLGFFLMSQVNTLWQLYLIHGLLLAAGIGTCWPILMPTVARWFVARRGLMSGIVVSGIGLGTVTTPQLARWLISTYDWRAAYMIIGALTFVVMVLAALFLKRDPSQTRQLPYGQDEMPCENTKQGEEGYSFKEAIRTRNFAITGTTFFCFGIALHTIMVHIVPHATTIGISAINAAVTLAIIGGVNIIGKITIGMVSDKIGFKTSLVISLGIMAIALLWLQLAQELWALYLFGVIFGLSYGAIVTLMALAPSELFGLGSLGAIMGGTTFLYTCGGAVGPVVSGHLFDITGSYNLAFLIVAILTIIASIITLTVKSPRRQKSNSVM